MEFQTRTWKKTGSAPRGNKCKIKFATLNVQGINMIGKRDKRQKNGWQKRIDILCIQETKINCNATENRNGFSWYFSSDVKDADRDKANKLRNCKKIPLTLQEKVREHRGVGSVCSKKIDRHIERVTAHDSNNIKMKIKGAVDIVLHNTYQPHAGEKNEDRKDEEYRKNTRDKNA